MIATVSKIKKSLQPILKKDPTILLCYIFGSVAQGTATTASDIDLAVYFDEHLVTNTFDQRLQLMATLAQYVDRQIDLVVLNSAPIFLRYVIVAEGQLLKQVDLKTRIGFELATMNAYFDFLPILKQYDARVLANV